VTGFTLLEHTADIGIVATGASLEEALAWLAKGMFSLLVEPSTIAATSARQVSVEARNRESLVVGWLNELLYLYEVTGFLLKECRVVLPEPGRLEAVCRGELLDPSRHQVQTVIKGATYHHLEVSGNPGAAEWRIQVILDV
jgi:SHS2 domain-containing protein